MEDVLPLIAAHCNYYTFALVCKAYARAAKSLTMANCYLIYYESAHEDSDGCPGCEPVWYNRLDRVQIDFVNREEILTESYEIELVDGGSINLIATSRGISAELGDDAARELLRRVWRRIFARPRGQRVAWRSISDTFSRKKFYQTLRWLRRCLKF
jgi:hypothetical protein